VNPPRGPIPSWLAPGFSLLLCAAAAFWIVSGVAPWSGDRSNVWHHYEYLADGFLAGHTHLSVDPDPELAKLKDPYDPAANARLRLWDASLYNGRYYLYYGPAPAVALMAPWRALTGRVLPQRTAVAATAAAGMAGLALLLLGLRRRHFPGVSGAAMGAILLVAFHAAWLPVILRRPGVWELPIVSAIAWLWWALYFLWKFHDSGGRARWAVGIGVALAFLMGSRVTFVFAAMVIAALALLRGGAYRRNGSLAALLAFAGGVALLLYNHERFGRWLEFGQSYQLWGIDYRGLSFFSPRFILYNMRAYLLAPPEFSPFFPFLHPSTVHAAPAGYFGTEEMYGLLFMMPVHVAGLAAVGWAWRGRRQAATRPAGIVIAAAAAASALSLASLACWAGVCSRYMAELVAGWSVVTAVGLLAVFGPGAGARPGRALRILACASACWTVACVWLASADFRGFMKLTNPATYRTLAHALDYPSEWWIEAKGIRFAPVGLDVRIPASSPNGETVLVAGGISERVNQLVLEREDGSHARLILNCNEDTILETESLPAPPGVLHITLTAPWLYPPAEHPYWDRLGDSPQRLALQTLFSVDWGHGARSAQSVRSFDASGFEPVVQGAQGAGQQTPFVESMALVPRGP
jgi:hypothetical protein